jgi:hypothetical protein
MSKIKDLFSDLVAPNNATYVEVAGTQNAPATEGYKNTEHRQFLEVQSYLPLASEKYGISPNVKDYVIVPVIILPTDIPNRNSVAFPYEELMKFNVSQGRPNFKTWAGKPTFIEHENADYTKAKGIVFDTYMRPLENAVGNIYKLIALCGFDRSKDSELARQILRGDRKSYSMGAFISQYECAVCGSLSRPGKMNTECGHVIRGRPEIHTQPNGAKIPSYLIARQEITGFEVSSVGVPAWSSATNSNIFDMSSY